MRGGIWDFEWDKMIVTYLEDPSAPSHQVLPGPATKVPQSDDLKGVAHYHCPLPAAILSQLLC